RRAIAHPQGQASFDAIPLAMTTARVDPNAVRSKNEKVAQGSKEPVEIVCRRKVVRGPWKALRPLLIPRQHLTHTLDQIGLGDSELRALAQFEIVGAVLGRFGEFGPELQVADRDLRAAGRLALVRTLDHGDAALAPVGVFELRVHAAR